MLRVVWPPHVDYVRCTGSVPPADAGFVQNQGRWWRPGWWAVEQPTKQGLGMRTIADAEAAARTWPQPWADMFHLTRVDIACDVVFHNNQGFHADHRALFTGRGSRQVIYKKDEMRTMYVGSRESPVMLRIYLKSEHCNERDRERWREHGWNGRDDVWRIEYEFHRKGIPADIALPQDTLRLWGDGLARIRMCAVPPKTYNQQNAAPTHPWWKALGRPERITRRAADLARPPKEQTVREILQALDRLCVRGGAGIVAPMMERLHRQLSLSKGKRRHGKEE